MPVPTKFTPLLYLQLQVQGKFPSPGVFLPFQPDSSEISLTGHGCGSWTSAGTTPCFHAQRSCHSFPNSPFSMSATYLPIMGRNLKPWFDPIVATNRFLISG